MWRAQAPSGPSLQSQSWFWPADTNTVHIGHALKTFSVPGLESVQWIDGSVTVETTASCFIFLPPAPFTPNYRINSSIPSLLSQWTHKDHGVLLIPDVTNLEIKWENKDIVFIMELFIYLKFLQFLIWALSIHFLPKVTKGLKPINKSATIKLNSC